MANLLRFKWSRSQPGIDRAVRRLVQSAYHGVPHIRRLLEDQGLNPVDIRGVADLERIPVTSRKALAQIPEADCVNVGSNPRKRVRASTSGSSGVPLPIYMSPGEARYRQFSLGRVLLRSTRMLPPFRVAEVGRITPPGKPEVSRVPGLLTVVKPPGQAEPSEQIAWLKRYEPQIIQGFPTALEVLVRSSRLHNIALPTPRLVVSRGEVLLPGVRRLLSSAFRAPIVDHYNCEEVGNVAWECPLDPSRMHINHDTCVAEVVDREGNRLPLGEPGLVALTNLYNYTMPFVRYVIGDRGTLLEDESGTCACGARGATIALPDGRDDDMLLLPSGELISPRVVVAGLFWQGTGVEIQGVAQYQLIQRVVDALEVNVVLDGTQDPNWQDQLLRGAAKTLNGVSLDIREVTAFPREASGKHRQVVSNVEPPDA